MQRERARGTGRGRITNQPVSQATIYKPRKGEEDMGINEGMVKGKRFGNVRVREG